VMDPIYAEMRKRGATVFPVPLMGMNIKLSDRVGLTTTMGSRLISRSAVKDHKMIKKVLSELSDLELLQPFPLAGGKVSENRNLNTSVNPAWRDAALHWVINKSHEKASVKQMRLLYQTFTNETVTILDQLVEGNRSSGEVGAEAPKAIPASYLNEASAYEPNWQQTFFGEHYDRLVLVKRMYDPENLLWCRQCVGSEVFKEGPDGRLYHKEP
jgi:hypothetical protein